jgi:hypothetical protein
LIRAESGSRATPVDLLLLLLLSLVLLLSLLLVLSLKIWR